MTKKSHQEKLYLNNPDLPAKGAQFEYTEEMIKEIKRSADSLIHFGQNHFWIVQGDEGKQQIDLYKYQRKLLKTLDKNRFVITLAARQSGKTTTTSIYALWYACFQADKRILIVANKEETAIMILDRIRMAYERLPNWLKPGVKEYGKTRITFENDSSIGVSTTTSTAARGQAVNILIIDEMAHIENHLVEDFWASVIPVISSMKTSKIFIVSTANGTMNKFYELYRDAESGESDTWAPIRIDWWETPGRGKKFKKQMIQTLGSIEKWNQEYENIFLETGESAIDADLIKKFRKGATSPKFTFFDNHYKIWEEPNPKHLYVVGVDVSEGVGEAASVAQIFDVTDLTNIRQAACFHDQIIDPLHFAKILNDIGHQWGMPLMLIERNNCGGQVIDSLLNTHGYENIADYTPEKQKYYNRLGIYSHTNAKYKGVVNMRYWVNALRSVSINDISLVHEFETFKRHPNGAWKKQAGSNVYDDRVMAMIWALFALETQIAERYFDVESYDENGKPLKIKSEDEIPEGYYKLDSTYYSPNTPLPLFFGDESISEEEDEITLNMLQKQGWNFLNK